MEAKRFLPGAAGLRAGRRHGGRFCLARLGAFDPAAEPQNESTMVMGCHEIWMKKAKGVLKISNHSQASEK